MNPFGQDWFPGINFGALRDGIFGNGIDDPNVDIIEGVDDLDLMSEDQRQIALSKQSIQDQLAKQPSQTKASDDPSQPQGPAAPQYDPVASAEAERQAKLQSLRSEALNLVPNINELFELLFGDLVKLTKSQASKLEKQYGEQMKKAGDQYAGAIPDIENSYASIGAADSTDTSDAKDNAKEGYEDTLKTIKGNKEDDLATIEREAAGMKAKWNESRDSVNRMKRDIGQAENEQEVRDARNQLEGTASSLKASRGTLDTDEGFRGKLAKKVGNGGRFEAATNALDSILKSSMSGATKSAAIKAVSDSAGLSDEERQKVQEMFPDVYEEQAAL